MCLAPRSRHLLLTRSSLLLGVGLTGGRAGLGCGKLCLFSGPLSVCRPDPEVSPPIFVPVARSPEALAHNRPLRVAMTRRGKTVHNVVISGTGLYTPANSISNEELVQAFNAYVQQFNADNAAAIESGEVQALTESSAAFIEKASGIKSRHVLYKDGILDPQVMQPVFRRRSEDEMPEMVEMALAAAKEAIAQAGKTPDQIDLIICAA